MHHVVEEFHYNHVILVLRPIKAFDITFVNDSPDVVANYGPTDGSSCGVYRPESGEVDLVELQHDHLLSAITQ